MERRPSAPGSLGAMSGNPHGLSELSHYGSMQRVGGKAGRRGCSAPLRPGAMDLRSPPAAWRTDFCQSRRFSPPFGPRAPFPGPGATRETTRDESAARVEEISEVVSCARGQAECR